MPLPKPIPLDAILYTYRQTGSFTAACLLHGISVETIRTRRKADPALDAQVRAALHDQNSKTP
jgi:hypothetical protein